MMDENEFMFGDRIPRIKSKKFPKKQDLIVLCFVLFTGLLFMDYYRLYYWSGLNEIKFLNEQLTIKLQEYSVALYCGKDVSSIDHESSIQDRWKNGIFCSEMHSVKLATAPIPPVPKNPLHHQSIIRDLYTRIFKTLRVHLDVASDHASALGLNKEIYDWIEVQLQNHLANLLKEAEDHLMQEARKEAPVVLETVNKQVEQGLENLLRWQFTPNQTEKCPPKKNSDDFLFSKEKDGDKEPRT